MATKKDSLSHLERTAAEPRDRTLHRVTLSKIDQVNDTIRLYQLKPVPDQGKDSFKFLPGQWLDVYVPSAPKAGGFTLTSSPSQLMSPSPYIELAIQKSPDNPPAAWLWRDSSEILGNELQVRVGGSFVWPPKLGEELKRVVFIAGGVGINPLISMVSAVAERKKERGKLGFKVCFLYTTRESHGCQEILFLERLISIFDVLGSEGDFRLFVTGGKSGVGIKSENVAMNGRKINIEKRRITGEDLTDALGPSNERKATVCYVCGVPGMTDEFVDEARKAEGMDQENVLFEKWW